MDYEKLFYDLLQAETEDQVTAILKHAGYEMDAPTVWRPLGDMENNFATVGNQQTEPTAALVEKIINGVDAVLMLECFRKGIDPEGSDAPPSMARAVETFFGVRDGRIENVLPRDRTRLAENIHLVAVGEKENPCYLVIDHGEGQTPAAFPDTFLSINKSNKLRIPFVQGKFNAGGTGILQFCGEKHNYQLIASRRNPKAPAKKDDPTKEQWGFTIVRRMPPSAGRRSSMYVYLAPGGNVPSFRAEAIRALPSESRANQPATPYSRKLPHGTCVKLYNYRWKAKSTATTEARYELERYFHSPCLPFRITETRPYRAHYYSTTVSGVWVSVASEDGDETQAKVEPGFPAFGDLNLTSVGRLPHQIVVFTEEVNPKRVPHGVFFTVNGQVHGQLPRSFVSSNLKFDYLHGYLLVSVDCTAMEPRVREDFFMTSRDRTRHNEVEEEIIEKLTADLRSHQGLRDLNALRKKKDIERALADEKENVDFFQALLRTDPTLASLLGVGARIVTTAGPGEAPKFEGRKFPTYFRLTKDPKDGLTKSCPINRTCRIEFETDAVNDYFSRADSPGTITFDPPDLCEHSYLWNGTFSARFRPPWNAKAGDLIPLTVTVTDVEREKVGKPFVCRFTLKAEEEVEIPAAPPGTKRSRGPRQPSGKDTAPRLALPTIVEVRREEWERYGFDEYSAILIRNDENGGHVFYINIDNAFLITELVRVREEEKSLLKFWFKYGLTLGAMGILQEAKRRAAASRNGRGPVDDEDEESVPEDLEKVSRYASGLARVIVPIIRSLYRGPQPLAE